MIDELLDSAELALASYGVFGHGATNDPVVIDALGAAGMSTKQAEEFAKRFPTIVAQFNDTETSFSATAFRDANGDLVLAIRGTAEFFGDIFPTDQSIALNGAGYDQIVAMSNWWLRAASPQGQRVRQFAVRPFREGLDAIPADAVRLYREEGAGPAPIATEYFLISIGTTQASGELTASLAADNNGRVSVTGHSLGGHLAMAFGSLFPDVVETVTVFNAPGFSSSQENTAFFDRLGGSVPDGSNTLNVIADEAGVGEVPWNAIAGLHSRPGVAVDIPIENQWLSDEPDPTPGSKNHSLEVVTDALAVYALLYRIDPTVTSEQFKEILDGAAMGTAASLERVVDTLEGILNSNTTRLEIGRTHRDALYRAIYGLPASSAAYQVESLANLSARDVTSRAAADIAYRYALYHLTPFIVTGDDDLYAPHNLNGQLSLYDPVTSEGLSDAYLEDKASFLKSLSDWNTMDGSPLFQVGSTPTQFEDRDAEVEHYNSDRLNELPVGDARSVVFAGRDSDVLVGGELSDSLYGNDGDDRLIGMAGADYLEGGRGDDTYLTGDGDQIFDHDGMGNIVFDDAVLRGGERIGVSGKYASVDGAFEYTLADGVLNVLRTGDGATLKLLNFVEGNLGIDLSQTLPAQSNGHEPTMGTAASEVIYGQTDPAVTDYEQSNGYNLPDHIQGYEGRDWIYAWDSGPQTIVNGVVVNSAPDSDLVEGGAGKDFIHGGAGDDELFATELVDMAAIIAGRGSTGYTGAGSDEGDFVSGQSGNDRLYGSAGIDGLFGGDGDDLMYGGAGDDVIAGDWSAVVSPLSLDVSSYNYDWYSFDVNGARELNLFAYRAGTGADRIYAGDGNDLVWGGAENDIIDGQLGDDELNGDVSGTDSLGAPKLPGQYHGSDYISGGEGNDKINGNGGSDNLFGGPGNDVIDGDFRVLIGDDTRYLGDDYLDGGPGEDILSGNGGSDFLLGGDDNDALFGDLDGLDMFFHGADVLYGGAGDDQLVGQGDDDTLYGGVDDDILYGDDLDQFLFSGDDSLFGGSGADELSGGMGDDLLSGGEGRDNLWGDPGDDRLSGGKGLDYLDGGIGSDTYLFSAGDSPTIGGELETLADATGQGNHIRFASDVRPESLDFTLAGESGDLILEYADTDAIFLNGGLFGSIETFSFGDGAPIPYQDILSQHLSNAHFVNGGGGDDLVFGSGGDDVLTGGTGDDRLFGGDGDDLLDGGRGSNRLFGGAGADTYLIPDIPSSPVQLGSFHHIFDSLDRSSTVRFAQDIGASDLHLKFTGQDLVISAGYQLLILNDGATGGLVDRFEFASGDVYSFQQLESLHAQDPNSIVGTSGDDFLSGSSVNDSISGYEGDDTLIAGAGRDRLDGGPGADVMIGGEGYDTYVVDDADDSVVETEAAGYDHVIASVDYILPSHVEGLELTESGPLSALGNELNNYIVGNRDANQISGGAGHDYIDGKGGLDVIHGGPGDDRLEGRFQISGGSGNDYIVTTTDALDGHTPIYVLSGGQGDDVYQVTQPQHMFELGSILENHGEGIDTLILRADVMLLSDGLPENIENLRYEYSGDLWFGADGVMLLGNSLDNHMEVGLPNPGSRPRLEGLAGNDTLIGSDLDNAVLVGGDGDDELRGMAGDDLLEGGSGDDVLDGGAGADQLLGGPGSDTYVFAPGDSPATAAMSFVEDPDGASIVRFDEGVEPADLSFEIFGQDLHISYTPEDTLVVRNGVAVDQIAGYAFASSGFFTQREIDAYLAENSPPLASGTVSPVAAYEGRNLTIVLPTDLFVDPDGDALQYRLASVENGLVPLWATMDTTATSVRLRPQDGDAGSHPLSITATDPDDEKASIIFTIDIADVSFSVGTSADEIIRGNATADNLSAGEGNDRLYGLAGDDWLMGGAGKDVLYGGKGNDLLRGESGDDVLKGHTGSDEMHGGDGNDRLYGREGEDRLFGGTGDDTLDGQAGGDLMVGGEGDDRYFLDAATDLAIESEAAGLDRVYSTVSHELGNHLEYLILRGTQDLYGGGNHVANHLYGNDGANELRGEEGDDYLYGRGGDDRLNGGPGGDVLKGELGGDEMLGGAGNDRLYGREGDDLLLGGPGDDLLEGGAGNDEYRFGRGGGKDRIHNGAGLNGSHDDDLLTFESSVGMDQIWFSRSGDDLLAQILDTPDQVRVKDWYADDSARIDRIAAGNGELIAADRVEQLIAAMAGFNVAGASVTELSTVQREDYSAMVTAYWQAPAAMTS